MATRIGINGFGRMGRLAFRAGWGNPDIEFVHLNEIGGDGASSAHLLYFDSVHGRWNRQVRGEKDKLIIEDKSISHSSQKDFTAVPWRDLGVDIVLESSGKFRTQEQLELYLKAGVKKVIVAAPVKKGALNIVMGVNDHLYEPDKHHLLTAASCTTNCLAPVVKVIHEVLSLQEDLTRNITVRYKIIHTVKSTQQCGLSTS